MKKRQDTQHPVTLPLQNPLLHAPQHKQIANHITMRQHHPLRQPGRATRINQIRQILLRIQPRSLHLLPTPFHQIREESQPLGALIHNDDILLWYRAFARRFERDLQEVLLRAEDLGAGIAEVMDEFADRVGWVGGRHDAADVVRAEGDGWGVDVVLQEEGEDVGALEGEGVGEGEGEGDGGLAEGGVGVVAGGERVDVEC